MARPLIRPADPTDHEPIWTIFRAVVAGGDTYAYPPEISRADALAAWLGPGRLAYVAEDTGPPTRVVGHYSLRPAQPGLGAHVCTAAFMVAPEDRRRGIGRALGEHALDEARALGFRAMQFNLVVTTNTGAIALWEQLGFRTVGRLPGAFDHRTLGEIDALVMYRRLDDP